MSDFNTRPQLQQKQLAALITVLQAADPEYNVTRHELDGLCGIFRRFNIPVDMTMNGAQQATATAASVDIRLCSELRELGVPDDAPLYYQIFAYNQYRAAAPLLKALTKDNFSSQNFHELWDEVMKGHHESAMAAQSNVDGRRVAFAAERVLNEVIAEEMDKVHAPHANAPAKPAATGSRKTR